MDPKDTWTCIPTKKLIQSYKRYPTLWNCNSKDYKNKAIRMECLQSIAEEVSQVRAGTTVHDIRAKIKTLRAQFGKEKHRRNDELQKGMVFVPKLWCYDEFKFIDVKTKAKHESHVDENKHCSTRSSGKKVDQSRTSKFPSWTKNQTLTFIQLLKKYPLLYDQSHPLYTQPIHRTLSAHNLLSKLKQCRPNATIAEMKSKINTLRAQRQKEKRKQQAHMGRTGRALYKPKLWCFDELRFLDEKGNYTEKEPQEFEVGEEPDDCYIEENENEIYVKSFDDSDVEDLNINPSPSPSESASPQPQSIANGQTKEAVSRSILHNKCLGLVESLTKQMVNLQNHRTHQYDDNPQTPQAALAKMVEFELLKVSDDIFEDTKWKIIKLLEEASRQNNATLSHR